MDPGRTDPSGRREALNDDWYNVPSTPQAGMPFRLAASATALLRSPGLLAAAGLLMAGALLLGLTVVAPDHGAAALPMTSGTVRDSLPPDSTGSGIGGTGAASSGSASMNPGDMAGTWLVDVAGAVARPGLYRLPAGSRVGDAVAAAGGFSPDVDAARVAASLNLAAPLSDGEKILVPVRNASAIASPGGAPGADASVEPDGGLVDLNRATQAELEALPGIGPVTAKRIIESRAESRFASVDDLLARGLLKPAAFEKVRPLVAVGG